MEQSQSLLDKYRTYRDDTLQIIKDTNPCTAYVWGVADQVLKERQKDIDDTLRDFYGEESIGH